MLYIVGTPIGNLEDLSLRQAKTLTLADVILTEDTRSTGMLLKRIQDLFSLTPKENQRLISYYKETEFEKLPEILEMLEAEKEIALISQAGMPTISDPGLLLLKTAIRRRLPFTVIPGLTAATTALVYTGFDPEFSLFIGFLPKKENDIKKLLTRLANLKDREPQLTFIFYESPHRITETLELLDEYFPDREVVITRELTKKFEEVIRGKARELTNRTYKGELTLIIH